MYILHMYINFFLNIHSENITCDEVTYNFSLFHQTMSKMIKTVELTVKFHNISNSELKHKTQLIVQSYVSLFWKPN